MSTHPVQVGLKLSQNAPIDVFRRVWRIADEAGFDHCWAFDHLVTQAPDGSNGHVFEGWSLLAAMAEATSHVRIGLLVSGLAYRHPALLAKAAVTVDHLSGGRLEFGIGAGWAPLEQLHYGIERLDRPADRLAEGLRVIDLLWTQPRSTFDGQFYRLHDAECSPKPVQQPRPPIWIGAGGPKMLRVAAQYADVWNPAGDGLAVAIAAGQQLVAACAEVGRDPATLRWSTQATFDGGSPTAILSELERWHAAGFTELVVYCGGSDPVRSAQETAETILPRLRELGVTRR